MSAILPIGPAARIAGPYTATAGQTVFTFAFALLDAGDLTVETAPAADPDNWTPATYGTEWSIPTTQPTVAGGNIVFALGRAAGTRVRIVGAAVIANTQDPLPGGRVESGLLNRFFDRTTIWAQEARRDIGAALALLKTSANGWTPIEAVESYGERRVRKIVDWVGGIGAKPAVNRYVGAAGLTTNVAQAVDIRGAAGGGVKIVGTVPAVEDLPASGIAGDAWVVGENLYVWSSVTTSWTNLGPLMEGTLETSNHIGLTSVDIDERSIPAPVINLATSGYSTPGDGGGAQWRSVNAEPAHPGKRPSLLGRWWELMNDVYTPQHFGVFDDPTYLIDQSAKLQDWLDACAYTGRAPHVDRPVRALSSTYLRYGPDTAPGYINIGRLFLGFDFDGGFSVGEVGKGFYNCDFFAPAIQRIGTLSWQADERASRLSDHVGLCFFNPVGAKLYLQDIQGFTSGYALHAQGFRAAYNKVFVGFISDCRYAEVIRCIAGASPGPEFANENTFIGGARRQNSPTNLLGNAYGTVITADDNGYKGNNTNRFYSACYELGAPAGATYRTPVLLDRAGVYNYWHLPRHESGKGPFGIADNGSGISTNGGCLNRVTLGYEAGSGADYYAGWKQVGGAFGNIAEHGIDMVRPKWASGPMRPAVSASGTAAPKIAAPFILKASNSAAPLRLAPASTTFRANARCLNITNGALLIEIDTSRVKTWRLTGAHLAGFPGRPFVQAYGTPPAWGPLRNVLTGMHVTNDGSKVYVCDTPGLTASSGGPTGTGTDIVDGTARWDYAGTLADFAGGAVLVGTVTDSWGTEHYVKGFSAATSLFGGGYQTSADAAGSALFTVRDEVKKIHLGYYNGTASSALLGFEVEGYPTQTTNDGIAGAMQGVGILDPLPYQPGRASTASANPGTLGVHGFFGDGDLIGAAGATSGTAMGWRSSSGALAPAWTPDTVFPVPGTLVLNDTDKIYELMTPGTSASSGGPTGTGTSIADGTAVWRFLCLKAAFLPLPNLP